MKPSTARTPHRPSATLLAICERHRGLTRAWLGHAVAKVMKFTVLALLLAAVAAHSRRADAAEPSTTELRERIGTGVTVNQIRQFSLPAQAEFRVDDELVTLPALRERIGTGMRARASIVNNNPELTLGEVAVINFDNVLKGPVTQLSPLSVLGQALTVTADTVLVGLASSTQLALLDPVEVSGFLDTNGSAVTSRIKRLDSTPAQWRLSGFVAAINGTEIRIGTQRIQIQGVVPEDCAQGLQIGSYLDVRANANPGFAPGNVLQQVQSVRCRQPAPLGTPGAAGAVEGLITSVLSAQEFVIGELRIEHSTSTQYRNGNVDDLDVAVRLEIEGVFLASQRLRADKIRFVRPVVRFEAPVNPAQVQLGVSIEILGESVQISPQTRDQDNVFQGIAQPRQLELRTYVDSAGQLFATRSRIRRNDIRPNEIKLQGPVSAVTQVQGQPALRVLGITVIAGNGALYFGRNGEPLSATEFFGQVSVGAVIDSELGSYSAETRRLTVLSLSLADDLPPGRAPGTASLRGEEAGVVEGTISALDLESMFKNGFEAL